MKLSDFIPPIVLKLYSSTKSEPETKTFTNFKTAVQQIGSYNQDEIVSIVAKKTKQLTQTKDITLDNRILLQNLFIFQSVANASPEKLNILDIGGACGANYFLLSKFFPQKINKWLVVETEKMAHLGETQFKKKQLDFSANFDFKNNPDSFDLCFAQGVIQYLPRPLEYLNQILKYQFPYIYISRQPLGLNIDEPLIIKQSSHLVDHGPGKLKEALPDKIIEFPCTIMPYNQVLNQIKKDYTIQYTFEEEPIYKINVKNRNIEVKVMGWLLKMK